jgi:transcriptional regulator with PAS, ATPase and Fis domain
LIEDGHPTISLDDRATTLTVRTVGLEVLHGPDAGRAVRVEQPSFVVGVGESADLRLTDPAVSREHLRIMLGPSGVRLRDEGSKNGTHIGPARIHDLTLTGDMAVTIGATTIAISIEAAPLELTLSPNDRFGDAIGVSTVMRHLFSLLERAADSGLTVLIEGESGVGKDVLARGVHTKSPRREGPFVVADCGAIPEHLVESELFGHERGAFTGADQARRGVFEEASGGTLFLDEIGELPLSMQTKLLRALEQREVRPLGATRPRPIDVRVIAATNRRLAESSRTGDFRSDLYYRLAVVKITVPPLRERPEDILPIARTMLRGLKGNATADFPPDFALMLTAYSWPGNARELRNVVEKHAILGLDASAIFDTSFAVPLVNYAEARQRVVERFEESYIARILEHAHGNVTKAAELAGIGRASFYRMLERARDAKKRT